MGRGAGANYTEEECDTLNWQKRDVGIVVGLNSFLACLISFLISYI